MAMDHTVLDIPTLASHNVAQEPKKQTRRKAKGEMIKPATPITASPERGKAIQAAGLNTGLSYRLHPIESYLPILDMIAQGSTATAALKSKANVDNIRPNDFYLAVNDLSTGGLKLLTDLYTACTQARADCKIDLISDLVADDSKDILFYVDKDGNERPMVNSNATKRHEMIANHARWQAGRDSRRRFGDKQEVDITVDVTIRSALQQAMARAGMTYDNEEE